MYKKKKIAVIIPVLNEEDSIPLVLHDISDYIDRVIVIDNGSTDKSASIAKNNGAEVYRENNRGYGWACLKGISQLKDEDIVVFLDGDYSDYPEKIPDLLDPIINEEYDFVVSNRFTTSLQKGAMSRPQVFGNKLSVFLIRLFWGYRYKDLGPLRAIKKNVLNILAMEDKNYGWTIEMQIKAIMKKLKIHQVDVPYRKRQLGKSKVSGTIMGVFKAGFKILWKIFYFGYLYKLKS